MSVAKSRVDSCHQALLLTPMYSLRQGAPMKRPLLAIARGTATVLFVVLVLGSPLKALSQTSAQASGWSLGVYGGQYYDTEPGGFMQGNANFQNQYILALNMTKTVWRSQSLPLSLEVDGMLGQQFGQATLNEVAVAPVLRWSGFPWNHLLQTDLRVGPVGISYTTDVGPFERGTEGRGSRWLNFLLLELAVSRPQDKSREVFVRLHHRCTVYDLINTYGANGEDFLVFGYRKHF